jgi:hypothetical protein
MIRRLPLSAPKMGAIIVAFLASALAPMGTLAHGAEAENICAGLSLQHGQASEIYFKRADGVIKPLSAAYLSEIVGRRISFCYIARRSEGDVPYGAPQRGAINVKVELWQPKGSSQIFLFNNHQDIGQSCKQRDFSAYQAFHALRTDDPCLSYGFHNLLGDFATTSPENRRFAFVFPPLSFFERLWGPGERTSVKRLSQLFNYAIPLDFSLIRIPFHFSAGQGMTAARIIVTDLLETSAGILQDPIRIMIK